MVFRAGHNWLQYILGSLRFLFRTVRPRIFLMPCYLVLDDIAISLFRLTSPGAQCRPPFFLLPFSWNQLTCAFWGRLPGFNVMEKFKLYLPGVNSRDYRLSLTLPMTEPNNMMMTVLDREEQLRLQRTLID